MQKYTFYHKYKRRTMYKIEEIGNIGIRILLYLLKHESANVTELIELLHIGRQTIYYRLKVLRIFGLLATRQIGVEKRFYLTEKGKKVAQHIF